MAVGWEEPHDYQAGALPTELLLPLSHHKITHCIASNNREHPQRLTAGTPNNYKVATHHGVSIQ